MNNEGNETKTNEAGESTPMDYQKNFPRLPESASTGYSERMRVNSSKITKTITVKSVERKQGQSDFGQEESKPACASISKETGAHIEMSTSRDQSLTFLVAGTPTVVNEAIRKITKQFKAERTKSMKVPKEYYGIILGKNGTRLKNLENLTDTKINIPNKDDSSDQITITGTAENIERACQKVNEICDEQAKKGFEKFEIERIYHPFLCGADNDNIYRLMVEKNVKINIPPPHIVNKDSKVSWTVTGHREDVHAVKKELLARQEDLSKTCKTINVQIPVEQHRYVAGPKDKNLVEILREFKVSVEMPAESASDSGITLRGPRENLKKALDVVYERASSMASAKVNCPPWIYKYVVGPKSDKYRDPNLDLSQVQLSYFEDTSKDGGFIKCEGLTSVITGVQIALDEYVSDLTHKLTFVEFPVDAKYYKHIIGKAGKNIERLQNEFNVDINIFESHIIRIEGSNSGVKEAKRDIENMIFKIENEIEEDMNISRRLHRELIGVRGENIQKLKDRFPSVIINIPQMSDHSDIVKLRGPKDEVANCKKTLAEMIQEIESKNYSKNVTIFKEFHKNIVGKNGCNIRRIREETNTKIELPNENDDSDVIAIRGVKENVEEAARQILAVQYALAAIASKELIIPRKMHSLLIGPKKKLIQSIKSECGGVTIKFPTDEKSDLIIIRGLEDSVKRAQEMLVEFAAKPALISASAEVRAKVEYHRFIIGRNGANIKKLRENTGARIIFPERNDEDQETILIIGSEEAVQKAREELETIIRNIDSTVEETMEIDPKHHSHFQRKLVSRIEQDCGNITISFPRLDDSSPVVILKGPKDGVEMAKQRLLDEVQDLEDRVTIEFKVPRDAIKKEKLVFSDIKRDYNVTISKSNDRSYSGDDHAVDQPAEMNGVLHDDSHSMNHQDADNCDTIIIWGSPGNCKQAKEAILGLIPKEIELEVPFEHHSSIIGKQGGNINKIRRDCGNVNIDVPKADLQSNIIKIKGPPSLADHAAELIKQQVERLIAEKEIRAAKSYRLKLKLDIDHQSIINTCYKNRLTKIKNKLGTRVEFKRGDDFITIVGYEDKCHETAQEIEEIIKEVENQERREIEVDKRIVPRLIGIRGRNFNRIQDEYNVNILSQAREDSHVLIIFGEDEDSVEEAKEALEIQKKDYMVEYKYDRDNWDEKNSVNNANPHANSSNTGFVVTGGPWDDPSSNAEYAKAFPMMNSSGGSNINKSSDTPTKSEWVRP